MEKDSMMHWTLVVVLLTALPVTAVSAGVYQSAGRQPDPRSWMRVPAQVTGASSGGLRFIALVDGPILLTGVSLKPIPHQAGARVETISVMNPRLNAISALTVSWQLYADADLTRPVAAGVTGLLVLDTPLTVRSSTTIEVGVNITSEPLDRDYRLEIGVESVRYSDGSFWQLQR
jgi:hypothetical protein